MNVSNQDRTLAFLMDKSTWGGVRPDRIDTHISSVFLVGEEAWKLKKAVRLPFLDFSTIAMRKQACERELQLNSAWAPSLYLKVAAITQDQDGRLGINGDGPAVDYLVAMRRFSQDAALPTALAAGQVDKRQMEDLVQTLWAAYGTAAIHPECGGRDGMTKIVEGLGHAFAPDAVPVHLMALWRQRLDAVAAILDRRRQSGLVRRCHGDLHLGNICLFQGRLLPFDALEFNEDFGTIDIAYDLAFLIMDLLAHGHDRYAALVLNRYLDQSGDYGAMAVFPLFLSVRAGVRAMVMHSMNKDDRAREYLALAQSLLAQASPRLVAVGGLSGSGKSRLAAGLSPLLACPGAAVIRSDAIRKRLMGVAQTDQLGPDGYSPAVTQKVYQTLTEACGIVLDGGASAIADAVFGRQDERDAVERVAVKRGAPFAGLWLEAPFELAADRIARRVGDASDATVAVLEQQRTRDVGPVSWTKIVSDGSPDETVARALAVLKP